MGIAVKNWTFEELQDVRNGNKWLATLLMNAKSYDKNMIAVRNTLQVKTYVLQWEDGTEARVNATDDYQLQKFISREYTSEPIDVYEEQIVMREVHSSIPKIL
jgi:hypothetical protein